MCFGNAGSIVCGAAVASPAGGWVRAVCQQQKVLQALCCVCFGRIASSSVCGTATALSAGGLVRAAHARSRRCSRQLWRGVEEEHHQKTCVAVQCLYCLLAGVGGQRASSRQSSSHCGCHKGLRCTWGAAWKAVQQKGLCGWLVLRQLATAAESEGGMTQECQEPSCSRHSSVSSGALGNPQHHWQQNGRSKSRSSSSSDSSRCSQPKHQVQHQQQRHSCWFTSHSNDCLSQLAVCV